MYYLSKDLDSGTIALRSSLFTPEIINLIKEATKHLDFDNPETDLVEIKLPPKLYTEVCERLGIGRENRNVIPVFNKDLLIAYLKNDNNSVEKGTDSVPAPTSV